ncbi:MAG: cytochrome P450 [Actinomycetes bacterium]
MDPRDAVNPVALEANPYLPWVAADPVPFYDRLRTECPVAAMEGMAGLGAHIISRYEDVRWALRHPEIFSSDLVAVDIGQDRPLIPLQIDPPAHATYRRVIDPTIGPREVAALEPRIREVVGEVMAGFINDGAVDAHAQFTVPLPCKVFVEATGLPESDLPTFLRWKDEIIRPGGGMLDPDAATARRHAAGRELYDYFESVLADRRRSLGDDLISRFLTTETDGRTMTHEEMLDICFLFILAGLDTVTSTLDCSLAYLAQHPEHRRRIADDPSVIPAVVEELLRRETPVMQIIRVVTQPTDLHGVTMAAGDTVILMLGAANTDPDEFGPTASAFDPDRETNRHLAFGGGPHRCLGSHLARMELQVALEEWHHRIPDYELAPDVELSYSPGIREIESLPLRFGAATVVGR